jgi:hypothetical protein
MESFYRFLLFAPLAGLQSVSSITIDWTGFGYWCMFHDSEANGVSPPRESGWKEVTDTIMTLSSLKSLTFRAPHGVKGDWSRRDQRAPHEIIVNIVEPLSKLPDHINFTFVIPPRDAVFRIQDMVKEYGCRNLKIIGTEDFVGYIDGYFESDDD